MHVQTRPLAKKLQSFCPSNLLYIYNICILYYAEKLLLGTNSHEPNGFVAAMIAVMIVAMNDCMIRVIIDNMIAVMIAAMITV
jgi:hypothetical protein